MWGCSLSAGRRTAVLAIVIAAGVCFPATALAQDLYAAPTATGSGTCMSTAEECTLQTAMADAVTSDTIVVAGNQGTYGTASSPLGGLSLTNFSETGISIQGASGQPRPLIYTSGLSMWCEDLALCGTVSDIQIDADGSPGLESDGSEVDHVLVEDSGGGATACNLWPGALTVIDSLCLAAGGGPATAYSQVWDGSGTSTDNLVLRNDTFYATGGGDGADLAIGSGSSGLTEVLDVTATNTIFHGATDIKTSSSAVAGGSATVDVASDHSNFKTTDPENGTTISSGTGDQTTAPTYVDAATGNLHEATGSVTIDHGENNSANGTTDLDGNPRIIGGITDIGAYEAAEAPTVTPASISGITTSGATLSTDVDPNYSATTVEAYVGISTSDEKPAASENGGAGLAAVPATLSLTGLKPGTLYHLHLVATNAIGSTSTADQTFTTAPGPGNITFISSKSKVTGNKAAIRLSCATDSTGCEGTLTLTEKVKVRGRNGHLRTLTRKLGHVKFALNAGQTKTYKLKLSPAAVSQLKSASNHRLKAVAKLTRSDAGKPASKQVTLRRRASRTARASPAGVAG